MEKRSFKDKFFNEYLGKISVAICGLLIIFVTLLIIVFITKKGIATFIKGNSSIINFLFKDNWNPNKAKSAFGALALILGSCFVSLGAVILSAPVAITIGVFVNVISNKVGNKVIKPCLEMLVGIPSVVYGWVGISVLVPFIKNKFGGMGFSLVAGIIVLALMILPTIATLSIDAIKTVSHDHIEASYGLGATRWQTIKKVIIPEAKTGILTGVVLGIARAFGEALAVQMVIGNSVKIPLKLTDSATTLTSVLTMDMANTASGSAWNDALWTLALVLLIISFIFIFIVRMIEKRSEV